MNGLEGSGWRLLRRCRAEVASPDSDVGKSHATLVDDIHDALNPQLSLAHGILL